MSTTYETYTVTAEGLSLSVIVWRRFKARTQRVVERIYEEQPELGNVGHFLPVGTVIRIPIDAPRDTTTVTPISLWT